MADARPGTTNDGNVRASLGDWQRAGGSAALLLPAAR